MLSIGPPNCILHEKDGVSELLEEEEESSPNERMKARTQAEKAMMGENVAMLRSATRSAVELPIANTARKDVPRSV